MRLSPILAMTIIGLAGLSTAGMADTTDCWKNDFIAKRVTQYMILSHGGSKPEWAQYFRPVHDAMLAEDPCWAPEHFGFSKEDVQLVDKIRSNGPLIDSFVQIAANANAQDPSAKIVQLEKENSDLPWNGNLLVNWVQTASKSWSVDQTLNDPKICTTVEKIDVGPVRNQQNPWCESMVSADMLGQKIGKFLSVSDLVLQYDLHELSSGIGYPSDLPMNQPLFGFSPPQKIGNLLKIVSQGSICLEKNFQSGLVSGKSFSQIIVDFLSQSVAGSITPETSQEMKQVFGGLSDDSVLKQTYTPRLLTAIADNSCSSREQIPAVSIVDLENLNRLTTSDDGQKLLHSIDGALESGTIVGIGLDSDSIDSGLNINSMEGHAVSIVGRRWNQATRKCEYLVRNSWGSDWADNGYKFVARDHLMTGVSEAVYLGSTQSK
jgi:hypothetical protein